MSFEKSVAKSFIMPGTYKMRNRKKITSFKCPHRVKSPACMRTSPSGTPLTMCDVMLWVSLMQTILNLSSGAGSLGFLVLKRITVEEVTRFDQKSVGLSANGSGDSSITLADIFVVLKLRSSWVAHKEGLTVNTDCAE